MGSFFRVCNLRAPRGPSPFIFGVESGRQLAGSSENTLTAHTGRALRRRKSFVFLALSPKWVRFFELQTAGPRPDRRILVFGFRSGAHARRMRSPNANVLLELSPKMGSFFRVCNLSGVHWTAVFHPRVERQLAGSPYSSNGFVWSFCFSAIFGLSPGRSTDKDVPPEGAFPGHWAGSPLKNKVDIPDRPW